MEEKRARLSFSSEFQQSLRVISCPVGFES